jgi:nucleotide-binding universal stress UspA family protein
MEESSKKQLEEFCNAFKNELNAISYSKKLVKGVPHIGILEEAREMSADLIIIGTHGRSGFEHVLFGSNTEKVIRKAPCPVLTVSLKGLAEKV